MLGSIKGQTAVTILMPMIALGFPLMDTIWATIRRFILGKNLFHPDKDHFHHRLMEKGYTHRRAVILLYGFTVLMGLISIFMVSVHDKRSAVLLLLVAAGIVVSIRRLGYFDYIAGGKLVNWAVDILDNLGLSRDRRVFFAHQVDLANSKDVEGLWREAIFAVRQIGVDYMEMKLGGNGAGLENERQFCWYLREENKDPDVLHSDKRLHLRFPLEKSGRFFGALTVSKDMAENGNGSNQTFNRIEHLRRTLSDKLYELTDDQGTLLPEAELDDKEFIN
jgi:UDP-GlcNAc:undecaprenyl-phosphate GlcNAc-1-phosphate transferase